MARYKRFTFLCDQDERRLIALLATKLDRTQSDAVRFVVISLAREMNSDELNAGKSSVEPISEGGKNDFTKTHFPNG